MKHYIYTYAEQQRKHGGVWHCHKTVHIYRVIHNTPVFLLQRTETFVDEFQLVMNTMHEFSHSVVAGDGFEKHILPEKAFEKNTAGGWKHYNAAALREAGIAAFHRI